MIPFRRAEMLACPSGWTIGSPSRADVERVIDVAACEADGCTPHCGGGMRDLSELESNLISAMADALPPDVSQRIRADLRIATVAKELPDRSMLTLQLGGYTRPPRCGQHRFPVEGKMLDQDGALLHALLFADTNDRLLELEIIRWDGANLIEPDLGTFEPTHAVRSTD